MGLWFEVNGMVRQAYVSGLFNVFFDKVFRRANERAEGRGVKRRDGNEGGREIK